MSLTICWTNQFKKDYKRAKDRGYNLEKMKDIIKCISLQTPLPEQYKDHLLKGNFKGYRECHIEPDWLLIYFVDIEQSKLILSRTGTHSDLFE